MRRIRIAGRAGRRPEQAAQGTPQFERELQAGPEQELESEPKHELESEPKPKLKSKLKSKSGPKSKPKSKPKPGPRPHTQDPPPQIRDEPILRRSRIRRWLSDRPRAADAVVIIACTLPQLVVLSLGPTVQGPFGTLCAAGIATAFWWRRSHPVAVLLVVVVLATLSPVSRESMSPALAESVFALYAVGAHRRFRVALLAFVASQVAVNIIAGLAVQVGLREPGAFMYVQPLGIAALCCGVAVRANRQHRAAIEAMISAREDRAAAAERARITAEMHDVVAHSVTVMVALAGGAAAGWEKHPERSRDALARLGDVGAETLGEMQRILRVLRERDDGEGDPDRGKEASAAGGEEEAAGAEGSGYDLPPIEELIGGFLAAGSPVELRRHLDAEAEARLARDPALATTVYRIVPESLTNALRHASEATFVEVLLVSERADGSPRLVVEVTDNGSGRGASGGSVFSMGSGSGSASGGGPRTGSGHGLRAMRERARAFRGDFSAGPIRSSPGGPGAGWRTRVSLPLGEERR